MICHTVYIYVHHLSAAAQPTQTPTIMRWICFLKADVFPYSTCA